MATENRPSENEAAVQGSIIINNYSYSGADIKITVNAYNTSSGIDARIDELTRDMAAVQKRQTQVISDISKLTDSSNRPKGGTPESYRANARLVRLVGEEAQLDQTMKSTEEAIKRLEKLKKEDVLKVLAEAQTVSLSTFRDKQAVRSCGSVYPKGFTRGPREIAGSMVFTVFHQHVFYSILQAHTSDFDAMSEMTSVLMDQLPPMDITILFANEYGAQSQMNIYGVEFGSDGQVMSIEDMMTEMTCNFVARDYDPIRLVGAREYDQNNLMVAKEQRGIKASDLKNDPESKRLKDLLDPFNRFKIRRDPFL